MAILLFGAAKNHTSIPICCMIVNLDFIPENQLLRLSVEVKRNMVLLKNSGKKLFL